METPSGSFRSDKWIDEPTAKSTTSISMYCGRSFVLPDQDYNQRLVEYFDLEVYTLVHFFEFLCNMNQVPELSLFQTTSIVAPY